MPTTSELSFPDDVPPPIRMLLLRPEYDNADINECDVVGICGSDSTTTCTPSPTPGQAPTCGCTTACENYEYVVYDATTKTCTGEHTYAMLRQNEARNCYSNNKKRPSIRSFL